MRHERGILLCVSVIFKMANVRLHVKSLCRAPERQKKTNVWKRCEKWESEMFFCAWTGKKIMPTFLLLYCIRHISYEFKWFSIWAFQQYHAGSKNSQQRRKKWRNLDKEILQISFSRLSFVLRFFSVAVHCSFIRQQITLWQLKDIFNLSWKKWQNRGISF